MLILNKFIYIQSIKNLSFSYIDNKKFLIINIEKGLKYFLIPSFITINTRLNNIVFIASINNKKYLKIYKLFYTKLYDFVKTISSPVFYRIRLKGLGLKINFINQRKFLRLKLGYSHFILVNIIDNELKFFINKKKNSLTIHGVDKIKIGNLLSKIISYKIPDSYKGKGFIQKFQKLKLKPVKKK